MLQITRASITEVSELLITVIPSLKLPMGRTETTLSLSPLQWSLTITAIVTLSTQISPGLKLPAVPSSKPRRQQNFGLSLLASQSVSSAVSILITALKGMRLSTCLHILRPSLQSVRPPTDQSRQLDLIRTYRYQLESTHLKYASPSRHHPHLPPIMVQA